MFECYETDYFLRLFPRLREQRQAASGSGTQDSVNLMQENVPSARSERRQPGILAMRKLVASRTRRWSGQGTKDRAGEVPRRADGDTSGLGFTNGQKRMLATKAAETSQGLISPILANIWRACGTETAGPLNPVQALKCRSRKRLDRPPENRYFILYQSAPVALGC